MSKQPQPQSRSNPQPRSRPLVPNLPSKTGNKSGGMHEVYLRNRVERSPWPSLLAGTTSLVENNVRYRGK